MRARAAELGLERCGLAVLWALAVLGCLLGLARAPVFVVWRGEAVDVLRILTTTALVVVLVLGPGLAARARGRELRLGFVPLPGLALLAATGLVAWCVGLLGWVHPALVSLLVIAPALAALPAAVLRGERAEILAREEWRVLLVVAGALGIAIGRALWSLNLPGELFATTIYRTLEVGDRPDSRIAYHVVELVAHGNSPWGKVATSYFSPYNFSSRGPLAGIASAPAVFLTGGNPPAAIGGPRWSPFDPEGFMAYRLAMMTFACTCFLSLWTLVERVADRRAAQFAVLLGVTTPFLVHEIWFTWPKLAAASLVLLAAVCVLDGRFLRSGLLVGVAYLVHPLALLSLPALVLLALWPLVNARLRRPRLRLALLVLPGVALCLGVWRVVNGSHYTQNGFLSMVSQAGMTNTLKHVTVTASLWLNDRLVSIGNTLLPLRLFFLSSHDQEVNNAMQRCFPFCHGGSPPIEHFFFQYWDTVPFGLGIVFFPLLLVSLWRALRKWPWAVTATVTVPFLVFAVYWGGASTGLLREGMHVWVLTLIAVVAVEQWSDGFSWLRARLLRGLLALRAVEVLLVAMLPTLWTLHRAISAKYWLSDSVAVICMVGFSLFLAWQVWRWTPASSAA